MRIDAYVFYSAEDDSIHMFTYRKNIEEEKKIQIQAVLDEMTRFYSKRETERLIETVLSGTPAEGMPFLSSTLTISSRRMIAMAIGLEIFASKNSAVSSENISGKKIFWEESEAMNLQPLYRFPISDGRGRKPVSWQKR